MDTSTFTLDFTDPRSTQVRLVGGKGAGLATMTQQGLPVAPGFTITTAAYRSYLEATGLDRRLVEQLQAAQGLPIDDLALFDVARSGRPAQYDTDAEARMTALACTTPPAGKQRWTLVELERAARQEQGLGNVSRETVRRMLKKTTSSPGAG